MKKKIYLLPGTMCNENLWTKLNAFFDSSYELIHVPIPMQNDLDAISKALNDTFEEEKVYLVGFSLGGYIASYFAVQYPHRIKKLFIVASSLNALSNEEIQKRQNAISFVNRFGFKGLSRKKVLTLLEEINQKDESLIELIQRMYIDLGKEVFTSQMQSTLYRKDLLEKFLTLKFPSTFFYCSEDRLVNHKWLESLYTSCKNIVFLKKESSSHMVPLENSFLLSEAIKQWHEE